MCVEKMNGRWIRGATFEQRWAAIFTNLSAKAELSSVVLRFEAMNRQFSSGLNSETMKLSNILIINYEAIHFLFITIKV
jgi:hypothetical protein